MPIRKMDEDGEIQVDFSEDEVERRAKELLLRMCGRPGTFNMETGQPYSGPQLSAEELKLRGYEP